ncbi:MAG: hypothetical protein ABI862_07820 [Ilumatobacteraceae bacterium]
MRAPEQLDGLRVVAKPAAIDAAMLPDGATMLRIAPDDAIVAGAATLSLDDPCAIVEPEYAFVHWRLTTSEFEDVTHHIEWPLPPAGQLGQGLIAGVPAKILIAADRVLLVVSAGLAHELSERLW